MFNPFKFRFSNTTVIRLDEQSEFLDFLCAHLKSIGCDHVKRIESGVQFVNYFLGTERGNYHLMNHVDGGIFYFSSLTGELVYEYRMTWVGIFSVSLILFTLLIPVLKLLSIIWIIVFSATFGITYTKHSNFFKRLPSDYLQMKKAFVK